MSYFPSPVLFLNLTDAASHSDTKAVWWRCIRLHARMTALFPAWAQASVNQACLQTAQRGWNRTVDHGGRVGLGRFKFIKNHHCPSTSRDWSNFKSLLVLISALSCECSLSTNVTGGKGHMLPSLLLSHLLKVSSVNILTSSGVSVIYLHRQSFLTFPGFRLVLLLHSCFWLLSLMWCQLLRREATYLSSSHYNSCCFALYPLNVSRHLQVPY